MPCTAGGRPVMIEMLLGLVKLGITDCARRFAPVRIRRSRLGASPLSIAASM
jgi:hypothetical protein